MTLKLFARSKNTSTESFEQRTDRILSSIRKPLIYTWGATRYQVDEISEAYISLWASTPSEERAREIYNALLSIAHSGNKPYPLDWLLSEILFEAFAASTGDRTWAAHMELEHDSCRSKEKALYRYQERLARVL